MDWAEPGRLFIDTETDYVTHLPGFEVVGVAVVADAVDPLDCRTVALGWFPASWPVGVGVRQVVLEWWGRLAGRGATLWQRLLEAGEIEAKTLRAWAQSVWGRSVPVAEVVGVGTALSGPACKPGSGCADGLR